MHRRITQAAAVAAMLAMFITGCTSQASNIGLAKDKSNNVVDTGFNVSTVGSYDSADTAVVISVDPQNNAVTFMNMNAGRQYTLYYDGTTYVKDKYSGPMAISQIKAGDVVDVNFLKGKRQIASLQLSPNAWLYDNIGNYDLGGINKTASIGSATYSLPDDVVVLSSGKRVEVMDIVSQDVISVRGIDHKIYSINVEKGHGYLRLKNDQALIGGWIEVGNSVIKEITEDMLLVVPEGSYRVFLSNNDASCTKDVVIERDKEVVLDVGDLEIVQDKTGMILLSVTPEDAKVMIDGKEVDISSAVELPYGIHKVRLEADGYDSLTKYIQVGSEYAKISFTLEEKKETEEYDSTISQNSLEDQVKEPEEEDTSVDEDAISAVSGNRVYIDAPENVEVYLDSNYIGISPVNFKKTVGSHTITLRKSGYVTKSYTIYLYNDGEDITYSFTDLEKESSGSISGNDSGSATSSKSSTNTDTVSGNESSSATSSKTTSTNSSSTNSTSSDSTQSPEEEDGDEDGAGGDSDQDKNGDVEGDSDQDKNGDVEGDSDQDKNGDVEDDSDQDKNGDVEDNGDQDKDDDIENGDDQNDKESDEDNSGSMSGNDSDLHQKSR